MSKRSSMRLREEGEAQNVLKSSSQPDTMFVSTKLSWKGKYERVFAITNKAINTIDPKEWRVTNSWEFETDGVTAVPATDGDEVFQLVFKKGKKEKDMKFSTGFRTQLVCEILRLRQQAMKEEPSRAFGAMSLTRQNQKRKCSLRVDVDSVVVCHPTGDPEWRRLFFPDISEVLDMSDVPGGVVFIHNSRPRLFAIEESGNFLAALKNAGSAVGINLSPSNNTIAISDYRKRFQPWNDDPSRVIASFHVYKISPRYQKAVPRTMMISQNSIIQRDSATYTLKSIRPLTSLLGIVRKSGDANAQDYSLEFADGAYCDYRCTSRDQLIAVLIDMARAAGNTWVNVSVFATSYAKRAGRLLPTTQDKDTFAMESCYLTRFLAVSQRTTSPTAINVEVIACAQDFVAQIPAKGISFEEKHKPINIKAAVTATAQQLTALKQAMRGKAIGSPERLEVMNQIMLVLQAMRILCSTKEGYKGYFHIPLVVDDLSTCMFDQDDGVAAAAMEVAASLTRPWRPHHTAEDTEENRRLLLTPKWCQKAVDAVKDHSKRGTGQLMLPHLMHVLESALCKPYCSMTERSHRTRVLECFADAATFMFGLFRSKTISLTMRMALLMRTIMENCMPAVVIGIQESALLEGVFLRHLQSAIFSDSYDQQMISRYLIELWADNYEPSETLLERIFPPGMIRRLGNAPNPHVGTADPSQDSLAIADDDDTTNNDAISIATTTTTTTTAGGATKTKAAATAAAKADKRQTSQDSASNNNNNNGGALGNGVGEENSGGAGSLGPAVKESKWHKLWPLVSIDHDEVDLIWTSATREELREAFDVEIRRFDSEIDLGLSQDSKISWNHLEFYVEYLSLRSELCVCGYYLSALLSAVKAKQALVVYNPQELFDRLYTLFLQLSNEREKRATVLQCLTAVYKQEHGRMKAFSDVDYVINLMDNTRDFQLRDLLLLFVRSLASDKRNGWPLSHAACINLLVELASEAHQSKNQMATPLAAGVLAIQDGNKAESKSPAEWKFKTKDGVIEGPFTIEELKVLMRESEDGHVPRVREDTLVLAEGVDDWKPLHSVRFLRWRLLMHAQPELTPRRVCLICCEILFRLSHLSPTKDANGNSIRPLPRVKSLLCSRKNLAQLVQLLLTAEPQIVDNVCRVLEDVVVCDRIVTQKLYITGVFFFALAYGGSNFNAISSLLKSTHLEQAFRADTATGHDHLTLSERSYLGFMLPESCIAVLSQYQPSAFAETFTGNFDNPEVIWKSAMRKHLMCMLWQHIGDFPRRLKQNPYLIYDFIPLPSVHYEVLANELWCHNFYLRTLCDTTRFGDWPIKKPVELLQAVLDAWRDELKKEPPNQTEADAKAELELQNEPEITDEIVRQAYKRLARLYHPDKNPDGRDKFERIQNAYDLLSAARIPTGEPDAINVHLVLKTHVILYSRFKNVLAPFKYPGFPMLLDVIRDSTLKITDSQHAEMLASACEAAMLICQSGQGNAEEFVGEKGIAVVATTLRRCLDFVTTKTAVDNVTFRTVTSLCQLMACLASLTPFRAQLPQFRELVWDVIFCLKFSHGVDICTSCLEFISRCAVTNELQHLLVAGGALWRATQLLFEFDCTMTEEQARSNITKNTQAAKNVYAMMACTALGRLSGFLQLGTPCPPINHDICIALSCMLTGVLALRLKNAQSTDLLVILNTNVEIPTILWNDLMRAELLGFVESQLETVKPCEHTAQNAHSFSFPSLERELYVGQIYVRVYNEQPETPLENPPQVTLSLLQYICTEKETRKTDGRSRDFYTDDLVSALQALVHLVSRNQAVCKQLGHNDWEPLVVLMQMLQEECVESLEIRKLTLQLLDLLADNGTIAEGIVQHRLLWHLLVCERRFTPETTKVVLSILKGLVDASSGIVLDIVRFGGVLDLLFLLTQQDRELTLRSAGMAVLGAICADAKNGPTTLIHCCKIAPRGLIDKVMHDPTLGVQMYDTDSENPQLIWNTTFRKELTAALMQLKAKYSEIEHAAQSPGDVNWNLDDNFRVRYTLHEDEIVVGGVYLRLFLKDPQFDLKDPKFFLEAMLEEFFNSWESQKQHTSENYMNLVSGIVSILKTRASLIDHIATLGYIPRFVQLLADAQGDIRLVKETAVIRLLHELASSEKCVERLASVPNTFEALLKVMKPLPHPLAFCLDTTKRLLERNLRVQPSFIPQALDAQAIPFLLSILEGANVDHVDDAGAAKVHAIGCLQMMCRSASHGEQVSLVLDQNPIWSRYKNQKHDLFISRQQKKDYFLTDGSASTTKLLLTAGGGGGDAGASHEPSPPSSPIGTPPESAS